MSFLYNELMMMIDEAPLSKLLPKVLRIAQELHDSELEKWVRLELHGYWNTNPALTEDTIVPKYRTVSGYYTDDFGRQFLLSDSRLSFVNEIRLRFGVVELEGMTGAKGPLAFRPLDFTDLIRKNLGVEVTTFNFRSDAIPAVLTAIRTQLSDHLVSRKKRLGADIKRSKIAESDDIIELKPSFYGVGVNLRALFRKLQGRGH